MDGVIALADTYKAALSIERVAEVALNDARATTEYQRLRETVQAYEAGVIDGKTVDDRKRQEAHNLEKSNGVYWLEHYERQAEADYSLAKIERQRIDALIGLTKAWLYSQSGGAR